MADLTWWRESRFGMFIHWGLYALPAGQWNGKPVSGLGEWVLRNGQIPLDEYEALAGQFNPARFDAEAWVALAAAAGMKYLVITAKHHDGFAMYHSPCNPFNIVDATPFGRDPMAELAEACRRHGLRLCFYYSQAQDWHAPGGAGHWEEAGGTPWWSQTVEADRFAQYLEEKVKPQVRELLTQYGPIGLIWFDTPVVISREQSESLGDLVHSLQPDCLVSGRVGHDVGDYGSLGDNQIPLGPVSGDWETPATLNDTWGYRSDDHHWKTTRELLHLLVELASKGVNYLLNVGPTALGEIPGPSTELLRAVGRWMDVNGDAIYGTSASPFAAEFEWGRVTVRGDRLYLLVTEWQPEIEILGLQTPVDRAWLLAQPEEDLLFAETHDFGLSRYALRLALPEAAPDADVSVIALQLTGPPEIDETLWQRADGRIVLPGYLAERHVGSDIDGALAATRTGSLSNWRDTRDSLSWRFGNHVAGKYDVRVVLCSPWQEKPAPTGQTVRGEVAGQVVSGTLDAETPVTSPRSQYFPEHATSLGSVTLEAGADQVLRLAAVTIPDGAPLHLAAVELVPVG
ncbi:MAG: alpha-L-fucosidase [Armatimonadetes bacterium]|nr:alpha-L-fucosidase [Armatimonadota bacterium]